MPQNFQSLQGIGIDSQLVKQINDVTPAASAYTIWNDGILQNAQNMVGWNIVTHKGYQYCAFYNSSLQIVVGKRQFDENVREHWKESNFVVHTSKTATNALDAHDSIGLGVDADGYVWVFYDCHASAMKIFRMNAAESIATAQSNETLPIVAGNGTQEATVTYPVFWQDKNHTKLFLMYRYGSSGNGDTYLYELRKGETTWRPAVGTAANGQLIHLRSVTKSAYIGRPALKDNKAHFFFHKRGPTSAKTANHGLTYFEYDMATGVCRKSNGSIQAVPITDANEDEIDTVGTSSGVETAYVRHQMDVDSSNTKHLVYIKNASGTSNPQLHYIRKKNGAGTWEDPVVLTNDVPLAFTDNWFTTQLLINPDDTIFITYKSPSNPGQLLVMESNDGGDTFSAPYTIYPYSLGRARFQNLDFMAWKDFGILCSTFQERGVQTQETLLDLGIITNGRPIRWFEWNSRGGAKYVPNAGQGSVYNEGDVVLESDNGDIIAITGDGGVIDLRSNNSAAMLVQHFSDTSGNPQKVMILRVTPSLTQANLHYLDLENPTTTRGGSTTKAAAIGMNAAFGTHPATASGTTLAAPGTPAGAIRVRINNTYYVIPCYTEGSLT